MILESPTQNEKKKKNWAGKVLNHAWLVHSVKNL